MGLGSCKQSLLGVPVKLLRGKLAGGKAQPQPLGSLTVADRGKTPSDHATGFGTWPGVAAKAGKGWRGGLVA